MAAATREVRENVDQGLLCLCLLLVRETVRPDFEAGHAQYFPSYCCEYYVAIGVHHKGSSRPGIPCRFKYARSSQAAGRILCYRRGRQSEHQRVERALTERSCQGTAGRIYYVAA